MNRRFHQIINSSKPVLVDFYADWCIPCRLMPPVLKEVKDQYKENIRILKVNVDHHPDIANLFKINNIPAVMVFQNGKLHWHGLGVQHVNDISIALREML